MLNNKITAICISIASSLCFAAAVQAAADLTPDQSEQVKLKSRFWMEDHQKAEKLTKEKKYEQAESIYKKLIAERKAYDLDLLSEYDALAGLYTVWGKKDEAAQTYKEMVEAREKLSGSDSQDVVYPLKQYASCLDKLGKTAQAKEARARAAAIQKETDTIPTFGKLKGAPGSPERVAEAKKMRDLGEKAMASDLQTKALAYFTRSVALNPEDAQALCDKADALVWAEKFTQASADFARAIKLKPDFAQAYAKRAYLRESQKQYGAAIADFDKAIALNPKDTDSMLSRAKLLDEEGKHEEAVAGYNKCIETNPKLYSPYIQRAVAYTNLKQFKKAVADYTILIERAPEDPEYYEDRAGVYVKDGELQKAVADYDKIIELNPTYSIAYAERAKLYEKLDGKKSPRVMADEKKAKALGY